MIPGLLEETGALWECNPEPFGLCCLACRGDAATEGDRYARIPPAIFSMPKIS